MKARLMLTFFIMLAAAPVVRADEPRRGPLGVFNWQQTDTRPSVPWPSVPLETAKATCLVSAAEPLNGTTAAMKTPPTGTVATVAAVPQFDWRPLAGFIAVGCVAGVGVGAVGTFRNLTRNRVPSGKK